MVVKVNILWFKLLINYFIICTILSDPIPGGCSGNSKIIPYQHVTYDDNLITVDCQAPSLINRDCKHVQTQMFHTFLPESVFDSQSYFTAIKSMLTVESIQSNGRKVCQGLKHFSFYYIIRC